MTDRKDQLAQWRRAIATRNRDLRNRRGKRPPKPIVGVVKPPEPAPDTTDVVG